METRVPSTPAAGDDADVLEENVRLRKTIALTQGKFYNDNSQ